MNNLPFPDYMRIKSELGLDSGYVLNLTEQDFKALLESVGENMMTGEYSAAGGDSKGKRMAAFLKDAEDAKVSSILGVLADYIDGNRSAELSVDVGAASYFREVAEKLEAGEKAAATVSSNWGRSTAETQDVAEFSISIHPDLAKHVSPLLRVSNYFHAVEESYKLVRERLRTLTGKERASDVFSDNGRSNKFYAEIFGFEEPEDQADQDFVWAIGHLNLAIQNFRNVLTHKPASELARNRAYQFISLASLAYELISDQYPEVVAAEAAEWVREKRSEYKNLDEFYRVFEEGEWLEDLPTDLAEKIEANSDFLSNKWLREADFSTSYHETNIALMLLQLCPEEIGEEEIEILESKPTKKGGGNSQLVGWDQFLAFINANKSKP